MTIVRFAVWLWSVGWLSYGASAVPDGNAVGRGSQSAASLPVSWSTPC